MSEFGKDWAIRHLRRALRQIETGSIAGEPNSHRDALQVCTQIASEALAKTDKIAAPPAKADAND